MRKSQILLWFFTVTILLWVLMSIHAAGHLRNHRDRLQQVGLVVKTLQLTDLCLATEAWHTRNPSLSDRHTPFQTHPLCLEHFPSGSLITPPPFLRQAHAPLD